MRKTLEIWNREEYFYKRAGAFLPNLFARIHDDEENHPAMIIVPGGVYVLLSVGEAEFVSRKFYEKGYNTFVLSYTNNVTLDTAPRLQPLKDISRAVRLIRKNADELHIVCNQVYACGFSAGGHLVGSLAVHYEDDDLNQIDGYQEYSNRPDAVLLNYPLVTGRKYKTGCGFTTLMGNDLTEADIDYMSLELHITQKTPPMFLIHGMNDSIIPVQHSMLLAEACAQNHVACEAHFLQNGNHGVTTMDSTAEDAQESHYVFNQLYEAVHAMSQEELESYTDLLGSVSHDMSYEEFLEYMAPKGMMRIFMKALNSKPEDMRNLSYNSTVKPNLSASDWFKWADNWLKILPAV